MRRFGFLIGCLAACAPAPPATKPGYTTADSAGTAIVTSISPAWASGAGWTVDSTPITRIGADEADPQQHFQYVQQARRLSDGRVVVVVGDELRWFGADGKYLRTGPKRGEGPGEFRDLSHVMRLAGDTLMLADYLGRKIARYTSDGALVHEDLLDAGRYRKLGLWLECHVDVFPDGSRLGCLDDPTIPVNATNRASRNGDPGPGLLRTMQRFYVTPPTLDVAHPIGLYGGIEQFGIAVGGHTFFLMHPFYATTSVAAGGSPTRIALATNPAYNIEIWTPQGKLERIIRRVNGRRAPTDAEKVAATASLRKDLTRMRDTSNIDALLRQVPVPDSLPAVRGLLVGPAGEVMVQRNGFVPSEKESRFDVFDATGRWLGELQLPPRTRLLDMGTDFLLAVRLDANDVPLVEVYRLKRK